MDDMRDLGQRYIAALWDAVPSFGTGSDTASRLAGMMAAVAEAEAQLAGLRLHLIHEARLAAAAPVLDQVRHSVRTTTGQAVASLKLATDLAERFPLIAAALHEGAISLAQAEGITDGLRKLPGSLTRADLVQCQETILEHADTLGPAELRALATRLHELVDPNGADAAAQKRLDAQDRAAMRNRYLRFTPDHHGGTRVTALLPTAHAHLLEAQLDAIEPPLSSYREAGELPSREIRRADALVLLVQTAAATGQLPAHGGDRPQVTVTLNYDTLLTGLGHVGIVGAEDLDGLSAGDARRLACDAELIPVVLGTASQPLDVGRKHRLFPAAIRTALVLRDGGCAFPGCTARPASCEAHHIIPWWAGGESSLVNAVLLCPHHHRLVEPDPQQSAESQWQVHLDPATGMPWFTPPRHIDPARTPRQHPRHLLRALTPRPKAPPCPDDHHAERTDGPSLEELLSRSAEVWHATV
ncbi:HNH endonuclease [Tessaracoccus sp. Y36]